LAVASALTLWSGYVYFADYFRGDSQQTADAASGQSRDAA
jgi:hypothetical protein